MDIIENGMVTHNVGLIALLAKTMFMIYLSFQVNLVNLVLFFFKHVFLLLQVFLFLYLQLDLSPWQGLRLFPSILLLLLSLFLSFYLSSHPPPLPLFHPLFLPVPILLLSLFHPLFLPVLTILLLFLSLI